MQHAEIVQGLRDVDVIRPERAPGDREGALWASMRIHRIASDFMTELGASSKLNAEWEFFSLLHEEGRRSADMFLKAHASDLGQHSTLDLDVLLERI